MFNIRFVNLTPHVINIVANRHGQKFDFAPSGTVARVSTTRRACADVYGVETFLVDFGEVTDLPAPVEGTVYIVSGMVAAAAPRPDVFSPGELVRDEAGRPVGCKGLTQSC